MLELTKISTSGTGMHGWRRRYLVVWTLASFAIVSIQFASIFLSFPFLFFHLFFLFYLLLYDHFFGFSRSSFTFANPTHLPPRPSIPALPRLRVFACSRYEYRVSSSTSTFCIAISQRPVYLLLSLTCVLCLEFYVPGIGWY